MNGPSGSPAGGGTPRSTPTSTTTGRASRCATGLRCASGSAARGEVGLPARVSLRPDRVLGLDLREQLEKGQVVAVVVVGGRRPAERVARPAAGVELGQERARRGAEARDVLLGVGVPGGA